MRNENAGKNTHRVVTELIQHKLLNGIIVDMPCGAGSMLNQLSDKGFTCIGLDVDEYLPSDKYKFLKADISKPLPLPDNSADLISCVEGIEHLEDPFTFVRECHRVLKQSSYLILTTPNISSLRSRWRWFLTGHHNKCKYMLDESDPNPLHHINMLSFPEMRYLLHTNNFRIEQVTTNQIKPINWVYILFAPISYLISLLVISTAKRQDINRKISLDTLRQTMKLPVLLGESMIILAKKQPQA